jgi:branched-chain amino acid transport system ATP-binding protein
MTMLLEVRGLETFYGASQALFGVDFNVGEGEVTTLIGRNGMGKSTTLKTVMGLLAPRRGTVRWNGREIQGWPSFRVAQAGVGLVPEGRQIFPNLSVRENLVATAANRHGASNPWTLKAVYEMFPRLEERERNLGNMLSGGEQQMLAIARALMTNPRLLILDDATEGLAPLVRQEIWRALSRLKSEGLAMILIDKNTNALLKLADNNFIFEKGATVWSGSSRELAARTDLIEQYCGV